MQVKFFSAGSKLNLRICESKKEEMNVSTWPEKIVPVRTNIDYKLNINRCWKIVKDTNSNRKEKKEAKNWLESRSLKMNYPNPLFSLSFFQTPFSQTNSMYTKLHDIKQTGCSLHSVKLGLMKQIFKKIACIQGELIVTGVQTH